MGVEHPNTILDIQFVLGMAIDSIGRRITAQAAIRDGRKDSTRRTLAIAGPAMTWITVIARFARFAFIPFGLILTITLACGWITDPSSYIGVAIAVLVENINLVYSCFFFYLIQFLFLTIDKVDSPLK